MAKVNYKFKPYKPKNFKLKGLETEQSKLQKTKDAIQKQRDNLEKRLLAEGIDPKTLGGEFDNRNILEKALNLRPDQNVLFDFFEIINRPVEAVKGAMLAGKDGENILEGAWKGLSGNITEDGYIRGTEFLEEMGIDNFVGDTPVDKFVGDVVTDIVLDPLTYVPAGILLKGIKKLTSRTRTAFVNFADEAVDVVVRKLAQEFPEKSIDDIMELVYQQKKRTGREIYKLGQAGDFDAAAYNAGKKGREKMGDTYRKTIIGLEERANNLDDIIAGNVEPKDFKLMDYVATENTVYKDLKKLIEASDDKIKIVMSSSANNQVSDIIVLKRYLDTDYFVKVGSFETKVAAGAFAPTASIVPIFARNGKDVIDFGFSAAGDAFKYSDETVDKFKKFINSPLTDADDATTIKQAMIEINKTRKGSVNIMDVIKDNKKLQEQYRDVIFDMMKDKGYKNLAFAAPDGKPLYISFDKAKKYIKAIGGGPDFTPPSGKRIFFQEGTGATATRRNREVLQKLADLNLTGATPEIIEKKFKRFFNRLYRLGRKGTDFVSDKAVKQIYNSLVSNPHFTIAEAVEAYAAARRQFRFRPTIAVSDDVAEAIIKNGDQLQTDEIVKQFTNQEFTYTIGILEAIGEGKGTVAAIARAIDKVGKEIKGLFSLKGDLPDSFMDAMKGIEGSTAIDMQRKAARLAEVKRVFTARDKNSGRLLTELFESGAYMEGNTLRRLDRSYGAADFFEYAYKRRIDGAPIVIPQFADAAMRDNFILRYNREYYKFGNMIAEQRMTLSQLRAKKKLIFDVAEKQVGELTGTVLLVKNDIANDVFREFNEYIANTVTSRYVRFGEKRLSREAIKLIKENPQQYAEFANLQGDIIQTLVEAGAFKEIPQQLAGQIGYMRHIMTKEAYDLMVEKLPGIASKYGKKGRDFLADRMFFGSVDEINAGLRAYGGMDVDLFDPDAFNSLEDLIKVSQRKIEQNQMLKLVLNARNKRGEKLFKVVDAVKGKEQLLPGEVMLKSFDEEFGTLYANLSQSSKAELNAHFKAMGFDKNSAIVLNKNARDVLKRVEKAYVELPAFVKDYDKFLNTWKGLTLITPGFHMRNFFGNMFNSYAVGMGVIDQGKYGMIAMQEMQMFEDVAKKLAQGVEVTAAERKIYDIVSGFFESGVAQTHRGIRDLEQLKEAVAATMKSRKGGAFTQGYNNLIRLNFNFAEKMDDFQRYMLYRWSLDKTGDAVKASRTVSEALFDYHHLTRFEKDYMKRLFPFYTFMKNNFIFQAKNILANPKQYARTGRAYKYYLEDIAGYGPDDLPDYATENMWLPIPMTVDKNDEKAVAFLKANLPLSDFIELVENPFKKGAVSITAPVKLLIEFGIGRDLFTNKPLIDFPGQTNVMEEGTGVLSNLRDKRGNLTITQSPLFQKILNDIGLRSTINVASVPLDILDILYGYQGDSEGLGDFLARMGILGVSEQEKIDLSALYEDLENLRELKKYYEQQTGNQLPVLPR